MRTALATLILLALMTCGTTILASNYPDSTRTTLLCDLQAYLYNDNFSAADSVAQDYIDIHQCDPAGYLFKAIGMITEMFAAEQDLYGDRFHTLLDSAETLAQQAMDTADNRTRAWMHLYLGHVGSYRALWESKFGSGFSAAKIARSASGEYKRGLELDSTVYDLYFGLGLYHYWKSARAGFLRTIGLIANDKTKGIRQLKLAADSSRISRGAAQSALIWIYLDREDYDSVIARAHAMLNCYPDSRNFLWPLAEAYYRAEMYDHAARTYHRLRRHYENHPGNYHNLIECDYHLAKIYEKQEMVSRRRATAQAVIDYANQIAPPVRDKQRDRLNYLVKADN